MRTALEFCLSLFLCAGLLCSGALAAEIHVPADYSTIQGAINAASWGDTIIVSPGTYTENLVIDLKDVTLQSTMGAPATVIDGSNPASSQAASVVRIFDCSPTIDGFTLTNGSGTINSVGSGLNDGGGVYCQNGSPTITRNIICNNDVSDSGAGIYLENSSALIENNVIFGNESDDSGGGIDCQRYSGTMTPMIRNCLIYDNTSEYGGGIGFHFATTEHTPLVEFCTLYNNTCTAQGDEMYIYRANVVVTSCIVWTTIITTGDVVYVHESDEEITYSNIWRSSGVWDGDGNINADPLFVDELNYDFHLQQDPCQNGVVNPCVDTAMGSIDGSTRSDGELDVPIMDMGYHYDEYLYVPFEYDIVQDAIDATIDGCIVRVGPGLYNENLVIRDEDITLQSTNGAAVTTIDGSLPLDPKAASVVAIHDCSPVIDGFTLTNGSGTLSKHSSDNDGGGIYGYNGSPTIINNVIRGNTASDSGAGIYLENESSGNISPVVEYNEIHDNVSQDSGGGIDCQCYSVSMTALIRHNLIYDNDAVYGGGMTFIYATVNHTSLAEFNTLYNNTASSQGDELYLYKADPVIRNTIVWNDSIDDVIHEEDFDGEVTYCDVPCEYGEVWPGTGNVNGDPSFVDAGNWDLHIDRYSTCINRGIDIDVPETDFDGNNRLYMSQVDIGGYEFHGSHTLEADVFNVSEELGGTVNFTLDAGVDHAFDKYCMLLCVSGTNPGTHLPAPWGVDEGLTLPLNLDVVTWEVVVGLLNTTIFRDFLGTLDAQGQATAQFNCPSVAGTEGYNYYLAYMTYLPYCFVSNPIKIQIEE